MWLPQGLSMPYQNPSHAYLELGGNALYRFAPDPHEKFHLLLEHVPEGYLPWFAFGYGLDAGTRYSRDTRSMAEAVETWRMSGRNLLENPHFVFAKASAWRPFPTGAQDSVANLDAWFHRGLGAGLMADGRVDELEIEMLGVPGTSRRQRVMEGLGAASRVWFVGNEPPVGSWLGALLQHTGPDDWMAFGRGAGDGGAAGRPNGEDLGLSGDANRAESLRLGWEAASRTELSAMVQVSVIPTPVPTEEGL